ncbi:MAG: nitrous oxide reductase family maturation protein NosD [Chloroflexi bacterium]|nr:nitrous oxide reductase family maturation protein NosD [Chloroflexota bacterium]MBT6680831.1 nitrous oxide reductase family maturation protein NosD [Chloroflexota bacterium]
MAAALTALLLLLVSSLAVQAGSETDAGTITGHGGTYPTLEAALDAASDGDTITVEGGRHDGGLVVNTSVSLIGIDWPVIDGGGEGTVLSIQAPDVTISGFEIRGSGTLLVNEDAGIEVEAPRTFVLGNRIEDALFGIYLREAKDSVVSDNYVRGKDLDVARRGDAIRIWFSHDTKVENNIVENARDVVLWYSERLQIRGNQITDGRYGLHFMYDDDAVVEDNILSGNSVGAFFMYSRRLEMRNNVVESNRGPSGYGIGMKDLDDAVVTGNLFADNRVGASIDNSPREIDSRLIFKENVFAVNDIGVRLMPSVKRNEYSGNSFMDNQEQVTINGGGKLVGNYWAPDGRGNYWSDYAGYDSDGDGIGDLPYNAQRLFENLTEERPEFRLFIHSPSTQAIDFAARAVPFIRPKPKLTDEAPMMNTIPLTQLPRLEGGRSRTGLALAAGSLLAIGGGLFFSRRLTGFGGASDPGSSRAGDPSFRTPPETGPSDPIEIPAIEVEGLSRWYGKHAAVNDLSFVIQPGQSVAFWGSNGAGKTTALRCLLGLTAYKGVARIAGYDVKRQGKAARRNIGLVPQEISFHDDLSVDETIRLYARLRGVSDSGGREMLERLELSSHIKKQVRQLSGGLRQRLALAVALVGDPPVLLLDEPTANLDAAARREFIVVLDELRQSGKTLIFASHRPGEVVRLADRVLVLENGKLAADESPDQFAERMGLQPTLRIVLDQEFIQEATDLLTDSGFDASRNGHGVRVRLESPEKGRPIEALVRAGIEVSDFELEGGEEWSDD